MAGGQPIRVRVGEIELEVETVRVAGSEDTSGKTAKAAQGVLDAFYRAQDAILEIAKSTAGMIEKAGVAARPDRVEVEFGLRFSVSGGVILAGVAGEASLRVTLGYDVASRPVASLPSEGPAGQSQAVEAVPADVVPVEAVTAKSSAGLS